MRQCISPTSIMTNESMTYYLMSEDEALKEIRKLIAEANEILGLSSNAIVRLLLNHFRWEKDTLTDRYWEDPDRLFRLLNVTDPNMSPPCPIQDGATLQSTRPGWIVCQTCYNEKPAREFYALACRHQHCLTCWRQYLGSNIGLHSRGLKMTCPSRCNRLLDDEQIFTLLSNDEDLKRRYRHSLVDTFVESNRLTRWCPGQGCPTIVKLKSVPIDDAQVISCDKCEMIFCFQCLEQWHDPIQCSLLKKWEKKHRDESMTGDWILSHTHECPGCNASIEKNGGCNHMTCRKPGCGYEFCWLCFGPWKDHAAQRCNVYRDEETKAKNVTAAREALSRYIHYDLRYQTHDQSLELEKKLAGMVEQRRLEMVAGSMSLSEQSALDRAYTVLKQCRRTLKYTYAFAYYLYRNNQALVFEQNQADLEQATEALSGFLEREIGTVENISVKLMDKTRYCDQRRTALLDHCKEGYSEHYWAGLDPY